MFWNYYVLKLLRLENITFSDVTLSDINVVLCYALSQYPISIHFCKKYLNSISFSISPNYERLEMNEKCRLSDKFLKIPWKFSSLLWGLDMIINLIICTACTVHTLPVTLAQVCAAAHAKTQIRRQEPGFSFYPNFFLLWKNSNIDLEKMTFPRKIFKMDK